MRSTSLFGPVVPRAAEPNTRTFRAPCFEARSRISLRRWRIASRSATAIAMFTLVADVAQARCRSRAPRSRRTRGRRTAPATARSERLDVFRPDSPKVPVIERRDCVQSKSFGDRHQARVHSTEVVAGVLSGQFADAHPVLAVERSNLKLAVDDRPIEPGFGNRTQLAGDQPTSLGDNQCGAHQNSGLMSEQHKTARVLWITAIRVGDQNAGVDQQAQRPNALASICSSCATVRPEVEAPIAAKRSRCPAFVSWLPGRRAVMSSVAGWPGVMSRFAASAARRAATSSDSVTERPM